MVNDPRFQALKDIDGNTMLLPEYTPKEEEFYDE